MNDLQVVFRPPEQEGDKDALLDVFARILADFAVETQREQSVQSPSHHQPKAA